MREVSRCNEKLAREGILISMNSHILEMSRKLRKEQMTLQEYTQRNKPKRWRVTV
jgi:hypothetical protein